VKSLIGEVTLGETGPAFDSPKARRPEFGATIMLCELVAGLEDHELVHMTKEKRQAVEDSELEFPLVLLSDKLLRKVISDVDDITGDYLLEPETEKMDQTLGALARRRACAEMILQHRRENR